MRDVRGNDVLNQVNHDPLRPDYHQAPIGSSNGSHSSSSQQGACTTPRQSMKASDRVAIMKAAMFPMTELAIPEGWTPEHQKHLEARVAARQAEDEHVRWLVSRELEKYLPEYTEAEEQAAEKVQACYEALQSPESDLAAIDKQIGEVEGQCISWEAKLTDSAAALRVEAHRGFTDWDHELRLLHQDRDKLLLEVDPLRDAYADARAELAHATSEREAVELNISHIPYWGHGHKIDGDYSASVSSLG
jgi:hypothetical protein